MTLGVASPSCENCFRLPLCLRAVLLAFDLLEQNDHQWILLDPPRETISNPPQPVEGVKRALGRLLSKLLPIVATSSSLGFECVTEILPVCLRSSRSCQKARAGRRRLSCGSASKPSWVFDRRLPCPPQKCASHRGSVSGRRRTPTARGVCEWLGRGLEAARKRLRRGREEASLMLRPFHVCSCLFVAKPILTIYDAFLRFRFLRVSGRCKLTSDSLFCPTPLTKINQCCSVSFLGA